MHVWQFHVLVLVSKLSATDTHLFRKEFCFLYCLISLITSYYVKKITFLYFLVDYFPNSQHVNNL